MKNSHVPPLKPLPQDITSLVQTHHDVSCQEPQQIAAIRALMGSSISPFALMDEHCELLNKKSGLSYEAIGLRGYSSIPNSFFGRMFMGSQGFDMEELPADDYLLAPICNQKGEPLEYVIIPTKPVFSRTGRRQRQILARRRRAPRSIDFSPFSMRHFVDCETVIVTNSIVNADSAGSHGKAAIGLYGGGFTTSVLRRLYDLEQFDAVPRDYMYVIDSGDRYSKFVLKLSRLAPLLPYVEAAYLPSGPNESPTTLASYLTAGNDINNLRHISEYWKS